MARSAIHPGEQLAEQLEVIQMTAAELGRQLEVPTDRITEIIHGRIGISIDISLRLGRFFATDPRFWLNLQALYDQRIAEARNFKTEAVLRAADARLLHRR